jgi:hypothetical protein
MLLHSEFFFWANNAFDQHPLALPLLREAYLAGATVIALLMAVLALKRSPLPLAAVLCLAVPVAYISLSALLANAAFGQPVAFGLFEERRALAMLAFFPLLLLIERGLISLRSLVASIHLAALICLGLGLAMQTGILGDLTLRDVPYLDPRKYRILNGTKFYMVSMLVGLAMALLHRSWHHLVPVLVGAMGLLLVSQTRSAMLIAALALVLLLAVTSAGRFLLIAVIAMAALILNAVMDNLLPDLIAAAHDLLQGLFSRGNTLAPNVELGTEQGVRSRTVQTILDELWHNGWVGMGALSLQWNNGFHRIYNPNFYLSDVGVIGEAYRFGFFLPVLYGLVAALTVSAWSSAQGSEARWLVTAMIVLALVNAPGAGWIAANSDLHSLMLAFAAAGTARRPRPLQQVTPRRALA